MFYERGSDGLPREWIRMMKHSLVTIASRYNTNRMVKEYFNKFYKPAAENFARLSAEDFASRPASWSNGRTACEANFPALRIENVQADTGRTYKSGEELPVQADIYSWARSRPRKSASKPITAPSSARTCCRIRRWRVLSEVEKIADRPLSASAASFPAARTGNFGFKLRVTPISSAAASIRMRWDLVLWG